MRQRAVEAELAAVKGEFEKSDQNRQNNMSIKVECYEVRLDALENRLERLGESLERFQIEVEPKLKEGVLEELLKEISTSPRQKLEPSQVKKFSLENHTTGRVDNWETPIFPSPQRRTSSTRMPKFQPEVENCGKFVQKPTSFDGSTVWEAYYAQFEIVSKLNN